MPARRFHGLLNGSRHFAGLAATETNTTLTITNYSQRGEGEDTTTLHGFCDAVNLNQLLDVAFVALLLVICHNLELQPAFTSSISQCLHTTVVFEARTVERHLSDACGFRTLSDQLTDFLGSVNVAGGTVTQFFVQSRGACQDLAAVGRKDLGVDVRKSGARRGVRLPARASSGAPCERDADEFLSLRSFAMPYFLASLRRTTSSEYRTPLPL